MEHVLRVNTILIIETSLACLERIFRRMYFKMTDPQHKSNTNFESKNGYSKKRLFCYKDGFY